MTNILEIQNLRTHFHTEHGTVRALRGIDLAIPRGAQLGLVGETGSGKSVTARSIINIIHSPPGEIKSGEVMFNGEDLLECSNEELREIRGEEIAMVFQDPSSSLDPVYTVQNQMVEVITKNRDVTKQKAIDISLEMLEEVEMPRPEGVLESHPHELSGGMKQRVLIAMTLASEPDLLIADEPTTALDVTVQKKLLTIFKRIVDERNLTVLWITHNLGVVAQFCNRVAVMYAGEVVEYGTARDVYNNPTHPYTQELLKTVPNLHEPDKELNVIKGSVPNMEDPPSGCAFHPRCPDAEPRCSRERPEKVQCHDSHQVSCLVHDTDGGTEDDD